jgi:hypothetical protein
MLRPTATFTNNRYLKVALVFLVGTLAGGGTCEAKSQVTRIEVIRGKAPLVTIEAPVAGEFTIWTGPGTVSTGGDAQKSTHEGDIADWAHGAVKAPSRGPVYNVAFLCEACEPARKDEWRCYGVRYAPGKRGAPGLIQIPEAGDPEFPLNLQTIYRGVEGQWFRASPKWEEVVRGRIQAALAAEQAAASAWRNDHLYTPPSNVAVGARPTLTPRH